MKSYVVLNIYCVSLYEMQINLSHFSAILRISLHIVICMTQETTPNGDYNSYSPPQLYYTLTYF